jgi:hypothetical protein
VRTIFLSSSIPACAGQPSAVNAPCTEPVLTTGMSGLIVLYLSVL